jgi:ABC-type transport system involved in cytochrome c biogenesis ATPase subunit
MKILELAYEDKATGWKLNPVQFSDLNLLVGVSGVGKTKILKAILNIKKIVEGESLYSVKWSIDFLTNDGNEYHWSGEFESFVIIQESLFLNLGDQSSKEELIKRDAEKISFKNNLIPVKLLPFKSVINILGEKDFEIIRAEFNKIYLSDTSSESLKKNILISKELWNKTIEPFNNSNYLLCSEKESLFDEICENEKELSIEFKFVLACYLERQLCLRLHRFESIKNRFKEIFENIDDIYAIIVDSGEDNELHQIYINEIIKKENVRLVLNQDDLSSGMLKTFWHLAEIYLSPRNSVILIDEFENSLGVNCLDSITEDLTDSDHQLQFIITSHHPYVINNVRPSHWKIVTRQGGEVTVKSAEDFHISPSRQKAYIDLINVLEDDYQDIEA